MGPAPRSIEWRERTRLYKTLVDERRVWVQRIHAELFHHGVPLPEGEIRAQETRAWLESEDVELSPAARQRIEAAYRMIDAAEHEVAILRLQLQRFSARQPACRVLRESHFGIGPIASVVTWAELGDCQRFHRSMQVVRHAGLDVTVHTSDDHRSGGHLSKEGPGTLRWVLFEAGMSAPRQRAPTTATTKT